MGEPWGQCQASANSLELLRVPITRILFGLWTPSTILDLRAPTVEFPHQICEQGTISMSEDNMWLLGTNRQLQFKSHNYDADLSVSFLELEGQGGVSIQLFHSLGVKQRN